MVGNTIYFNSECEWLYILIFKYLFIYCVALLIHFLLPIIYVGYMLSCLLPETYWDSNILYDLNILRENSWKLIWPTYSFVRHCVQGKSNGVSLSPWGSKRLKGNESKLKGICRYCNDHWIVFVIYLSLYTSTVVSMCNPCCKLFTSFFTNLSPYWLINFYFYIHFLNLLPSMCFLSFSIVFIVNNYSYPKQSRVWGWRWCWRRRWRQRCAR